LVTKFSTIAFLANALARVNAVSIFASLSAYGIIAGGSGVPRRIPANAIKGVIAISVVAAGHHNATVASLAFPTDFTSASVGPHTFSVGRTSLLRAFAGSEAANRKAAIVVLTGPTGKANHVVLVITDVMFRFPETLGHAFVVLVVKRRPLISWISLGEGHKDSQESA